MPGMTGDDLANRVRVDHPHLPVLMVSGYADLAPGVVSQTARLAKPFSEEALALAIAQVAGRNLSTESNQIN